MTSPMILTDAPPRAPRKGPAPAHEHADIVEIADYLKAHRDQWGKLPLLTHEPSRFYQGLRGHGLTVRVRRVDDHPTAKYEGGKLNGQALRQFEVWAVAPAGELTPVFPRKRESKTNK